MKSVGATGCWGTLLLKFSVLKSIGGGGFGEVPTGSGLADVDFGVNDKFERKRVVTWTHGWNSRNMVRSLRFSYWIRQTWNILIVLVVVPYCLNLQKKLTSTSKNDKIK